MFRGLIALLFAMLFLGLLPDFPAFAATRTFALPEVRGKRLDWCAHFGSACGKPAADLFCHENGLGKATRFEIAPNIGRRGIDTLVFGDGRLCHGPTCSGFRTITCATPGHVAQPPARITLPPKTQPSLTLPAGKFLAPVPKPSPRPAQAAPAAPHIAAPQQSSKPKPGANADKQMARPALGTGTTVSTDPGRAIGLMMPAGAFLYWCSGGACDFRLSNDVDLTDIDSTKSWNFRWDISKIAEAGGARWQLTTAPFPVFRGGKPDDMTPPHLADTGELANGSNSVGIDFRALANKLSKGGAMPGIFYLRILPIAAPGRPPVGQPSNVIRIYYGEKPPPAPPLTLPSPPKPLNMFSVRIVSFAPPDFFNPNAWGCIIVRDNAGASSLDQLKWPENARKCPDDYRGRGYDIDSFGDFLNWAGNGLESSLDWISNAYGDLKKVAVDVVMNYTPFGQQCAAIASAAGGGSGYCRTIANAAVNSGMVALGIPPSIPNFNQLVDEGVDGAVDMASQTFEEQTGVPCVGPCHDALHKAFSAAADQLRHRSQQPDCGVSASVAHSYGREPPRCAPSGVVVEPAPGAVARPPVVIVEVTRRRTLPDANNPPPKTCRVGAGIGFHNHLDAYTATGPTPHFSYNVPAQDVEGQLYRPEGADLPSNMAWGKTVRIPLVFESPQKFEFPWTHSMWRTSQIPARDEQGPMGPDWFTLYSGGTASISAGTNCGGDAKTTASLQKF